MNLRSLCSLKIYTALEFRNKKYFSFLYTKLELIALCNGSIVRIIPVAMNNKKILCDDIQWTLLLVATPQNCIFLSLIFLFCCSDGYDSGAF